MNYVNCVSRKKLHSAERLNRKFMDVEIENRRNDAKTTSIFAKYLVNGSHKCISHNLIHSEIHFD